MKLVELTADDGIVIAVNPARIVWIMPHKQKSGHTIVRVIEQEPLMVSGDYASIVALVNDALLVRFWGFFRR